MATAMITTVRERCRMCYTCVRECPAKAIRVATGQAEVIDDGALPAVTAFGFVPRAPSRSAAASSKSNRF